MFLFVTVPLVSEISETCLYFRNAVTSGDELYAFIRLISVVI